jgi:ATP-dependent helicase HepA
MSGQLRGEIERLEDLRQMNSHVSELEIEAVREQQTALYTAIGSARIRLDALKLVFRAP